MDERTPLSFQARQRSCVCCIMLSLARGERSVGVAQRVRLAAALVELLRHLVMLLVELLLQIAHDLALMLEV